MNRYQIRYLGYADNDQYELKKKFKLGNRKFFIRSLKIKSIMFVY